MTFASNTIKSAIDQTLSCQAILKQRHLFVSSSISLRLVITDHNCQSCISVPCPVSSNQAFVERSKCFQVLEDMPRWLNASTTTHLRHSSHNESRIMQISDQQPLDLTSRHIITVCVRQNCNRIISVSNIWQFNIKNFDFFTQIHCHYMPNYQIFTHVSQTHCIFSSLRFCST